MAKPVSTISAKDLGLQDVEEEELDVLDLPQLYTKPSAPILLSTLADLSSEPPSWETTPRSSRSRTASGTSTPLRRRKKVRSEGLPRYLTKIISSPLAWIDDDDEKEQVWEAASQRLSERSGRTAMGDITRTFAIPLSIAASTAAEFGLVTTEQALSLDLDEFVELSIHEPALTSDNLGFKTWASSFLLAKRLASVQSSIPELEEDGAILELGAGTGLVGMSAAVVFRRHVILTDLPEIVSNLDRNVRANAAHISARGGVMSTAVLDWSKPQDFTLCEDTTLPANSFPLIFAADPVYSTEHPTLLVNAISYHLSRDADARVVIELPLRDAFAAERQDLRDTMAAAGLAIMKQGEEVGHDDWSSGKSDEPAEVKCWWSIWGWHHGAR